MTADRSAALVAAADALAAAADALRAVGRSLVYDLIAAGRVRSLRVGRRRLVPSGAIADYIAGARA